MITRRRLICLAVALSVGVAGCNKVPLLAPSGSKIVVTTTATALPINGSADIIVQILEPAGTPPQDGTRVTFTTTLGTVQPAEAETSGGRVRAKFLAGTTSGTATIIVTSGGAVPAVAGSATAPGSDTVKIAIGSAAVGSVSLVASPGTIPSTGGNSAITATVIDTGGGTLSAVPVSFSTDVGSVSPTVVATDASGKAQTTLTTARTAKVTASAGVPVGATPAPSSSVTVTVNVTQTITIAVPTGSQTVGQAVTLTLTYGGTGASPTTRVSVNWGDGVVDNFTGQPGAISHAFQSAGSFVVQVTGTDSSGDATTTSASVTVGPGPRPTIGMTVDNDNPSVNTTPVNFTVNASEVPTGTSAAIRNVHLDFGDGSSVDLGATGTSARHTYTTTGSKTAVATATDTNGRTATAQVTITVKP